MQDIDERPIKGGGGIDSITCWELFRIAGLLRQCRPGDALIEAELRRMADRLHSFVSMVESGADTACVQ
jgi:hypothetical protein